MPRCLCSVLYDAISSLRLYSEIKTESGGSELEADRLSSLRDVELRLIVCEPSVCPLIDPVCSLAGRGLSMRSVGGCRKRRTVWSASHHIHIHIHDEPRTSDVILTITPGCSQKLDLVMFSSASKKNSLVPLEVFMLRNYCCHFS